MTSPTPPATDLLVSTRRVVALSAVAGCVEVVGFLDCSDVYPGIMTGNTVQLGLTLATAQWARLTLIAYAVASFFAGGIIASVVRRHLSRPPFELMVMAALLVAASLVRLDTSWRVALELPLLAIAMAMQGKAVTSFAGVSIQTIVVTNSMLKFTDALAGRYLARRSTGAHIAPSPGLPEVLLPGLAWLTYSAAAGIAAALSASFRWELLVPAAILIAVGIDLLREDID
jgi:uncharacterized membrane protein YoaK (UPF0700 family)